MVSKHDRQYDEWQRREQARYDRETDQSYSMNLIDLMPIREVGIDPGTVRGKGVDFIAWDENFTLSENKVTKPEQPGRPSLKVNYDELFRRHERNHNGRSLTGSEKRKVIAAEKIRLQDAARDWDTQHEAELLEELDIELTRAALGFGGW